MARARSERALLPGKGDPLLEPALGLQRLVSANGRHARRVLFQRRLAVLDPDTDPFCLDRPAADLGAVGMVVATVQQGGRAAGRGVGSDGDTLRLSSP